MKNAPQVPAPSADFQDGAAKAMLGCGVLIWRTLKFAFYVTTIYFMATHW